MKVHEIDGDKKKIIFYLSFKDGECATSNHILHTFDFQKKMNKHRGSKIVGVGA